RVDRKAHGDRVVQLSSRSLRPRLRYQHERRPARVQRVHRLWTRTDRARALQDSRLHPGVVAGLGARRADPMTKRALALDPRTYERHPIHRDGRIWAETNCYVDIWIELMHALGY